MGCLHHYAYNLAGVTFPALDTTNYSQDEDRDTQQDDYSCPVYNKSKVQLDLVLELVDAIVMCHILLMRRFHNNYTKVSKKLRLEM